MLITIDGLAASGKSTAARGLALRMGYAYLNTGAMYRGIAFAALQIRVDPANEDALGECARDARLQFSATTSGTLVQVDGRIVSAELHDPQVTQLATIAAASFAVRHVVIPLQRQIARQTDNIVTDGRDQGSVVFPDAEAKFYFIANETIRARRRLYELTQRGIETCIDEVLEELLRRDRHDQTRALGPLVKPAGAYELDTSFLTEEEVIRLMEEHVRVVRQMLGSQKR